MGEDAVRFGPVRSVMVFTADPGASCAWWAAVLGRPVRADGDFRWLELADGTELGFHPQDPDKNPAGASTVVYWQVDSVAAALERLTAAGAQRHRGPLTVAPGRRIAQVRDPFGAVIGLDGP